MKYGRCTRKHELGWLLAEPKGGPVHKPLEQSF